MLASSYVAVASPSKILANFCGMANLKLQVRFDTRRLETSRDSEESQALCTSLPAFMSEGSTTGSKKESLPTAGNWTWCTESAQKT